MTLTFKVAHGALWQLIFQHNTSCGYFTKENAEFNVEEGRFNFIKYIDSRKYVNRYNSSYEFLLEYPVEFPNQYNRWIQLVNPLEIDEESGLSSVPGFSPDHIDFPNLFGGLAKSNSGSCLLDGELGTKNWCYAIGDWNGYYSPRTPGPHPDRVKSIYLWIRVIDNETINNTKLQSLFFLLSSFFLSN